MNTAPQQQIIAALVVQNAVGALSVFLDCEQNLNDWSFLKV